MKKFDLITEFLKNVSFESPNVPALFFQKGNEQAQISINIDIQVKGADNNLYMVDLIVCLNSLLNTDNSIIFAVVCIYSGLVHVEKCENEEELRRTLMIDVPTMIFPSAKTLIEQIIMTSGFPPFKMQSVDFNALYENRQSDSDANPDCTSPESTLTTKSGKLKKGKLKIG